MGGIVKGLFGGKSRGEKKLERFRPVGFSSPGLSGSFNSASNRFSLSRSPANSAALQGLVQGFQGRAKALRGLRDQVRPGFGRLTRERVEAIRNSRNRTVGNLREELSKRRVLGSSFAQREVAGVEASFGQQEELARAESFLGELDLSRQLISEEFQSTIDAAGALVQQFNIDSALAASLSTAAGAQVNANLAAQAQAAAAQDEGAGDFLGLVTGLIFG